MNAKPLLTALLLSLSWTTFAQSPDSSTGAGKGTAADGSRPQDGAIQGGSILPGENAGVPGDRAKNRCNDLTGVLREQCLEQERQGSTSGGTREPELDVAKPPPAREAPPPQNPR